MDIEQLARRFQGISLEYRRNGTDWPKPWRLRVFASKNERDEYRITVYGDSADEAFAALAVQLEIVHAESVLLWEAIEASVARWQEGQPGAEVTRVAV